MSGWRDVHVFLASVVLIAIAGGFIQESYFLHVLVLALIWCIVVSAWDLLMGYAGVLNFGQLVFFAAGGYAGLMLQNQAGISPWTALLGATLISGALGALIAFPCLRLRGEYVALFTFAVHLACPTLLQQGKPYGTGGSGGLWSATTLSFGPIEFTTSNKIAWFYLALAFAAAAIYLVYFVVLKGKWGRAFIVLRDLEDAARSLGVNGFKYKLLAFVLSASLTGLAGGLYTSYVGVITPNVLGNEFFLIVMVMLSIGGLGRFPGVIIGAVIVTVGNEFLRDFGQYRMILLGLTVIVTLIFLPKGLVSLPDRIRWRPWRKSEGPSSSQSLQPEILARDVN